MIVVVAAAGLGLLALPALVRVLGRRLPQGWWSALCMVALAGGAALVVLAGLASSLPTVLRLVGLPKVARACEAMLGHVIPSGSVIAWGVLGITASVLLIAARSLHRSRCVVQRSWVEPSVARRLDGQGAHEVVVLDLSCPQAMSVPGSKGRPGQVVVTSGLLDSLSPAELDLVCAHEAAHLQLGHGRYLALATAIERAIWFWPPAEASCRALRLALERWADETAVGQDPVARERLRGALLAVAVDGAEPALAAFSALDGLFERLSAMSEPAGASVPALWWPLMLSPGLALGIVAIFALAHLGSGAYCVLSMPHSCTLG